MVISDPQTVRSNSLTQVIPDLPENIGHAEDVTPEDMERHVIDYARDRGMIVSGEPESLFAMAATPAELQKVGLSGASYSPTCRRSFFVVILRGDFVDEIEYIGYVFDQALYAPSDEATWIQSSTIDPLLPVLDGEPVTPPITGSPDAEPEPPGVISCEDVWI